MPKKGDSRKTSDEHVCKFVFDREKNESWCSCGKLSVTREEFKRRVAMWSEYYAECRKTEAFTLYQAMRAAIKANNKPLAKQILTRVRQIRESGQLLPQPPKVDPRDYVTKGKFEMDEESLSEEAMEIFSR